MHQNAFGGRAPPGPAAGAYSAPPDPLAGFGGPTSKGKGEGRGKEGRGEDGGEGKGRERRGREKRGGERGERGGGGRGVQLKKILILRPA